MAQYNTISTYTIVILAMEICQILWFTYAIMNQPTTTIREIEFDTILTDQNAMEKIQMIKQQREINACRLEDIKQKQFDKAEKMKKRMNAFDYKTNEDFIRNFKNTDNKGHNKENDPYTQY